MTGGLAKLMHVSSASILELTGEQYEVRVPECLLPLYEKRNGFYAFETALHVFPVGEGRHAMDLLTWNGSKLWRDKYGDLVRDDWVFFAEDAFGGQFVVTDEGQQIQTFDPETGETEYLANNIEGWSSALLADYQTLTGQPLAHEWQVANGPLTPGKRLLPKTPFVLGGEFAVSNLYASDAVTGMRVRGEIARQIKDMPDGTQVKLNFVE